jgi:hypothetical protein
MFAHQNRLLAIVQAAHDSQDIERFCQEAVSAGFTVETPRELVRRSRDLLGWACSARRPACSPGAR